MADTGPKSKSAQTSISLDPAVMEAGRLLADKRFPLIRTGTFSAYIADLITRDVIEELRRNNALRESVPYSASVNLTPADAAKAFLNALAKQHGPPERGGSPPSPGAGGKRGQDR